MTRYVSAEMRKFVSDRAHGRCEYCRVGQFSIVRHHIEHIVPLKHGGQTVLENLALSCPACNEQKGTDVGSFDFEGDGLITRFFNPRIDEWEKCFSFGGTDVQPLTAEARVTVKILKVNGDDRIEERSELIEAGLYE